MEIKKGTFKREVGKVEIRDFEISNIIINSLTEKGFDIVSEPIIDNMKNGIGERITIYRVDQR